MPDKSQNLSGTESYCKGTTKQQKHTARAVLPFMFHYRYLGCGLSLFCASLPSYSRSFGCILVAEWVHSSRGRLQTGCKQGAPTPPARYSGCILGANRVHANSECDSATLVLVNSKLPNARRPSGQAMESDGDIAPDGITHLLSQRGNRRKSTAWLNWFGRETTVDDDFPPRSQSYVRKTPLPLPWY